MKDTQKAQSVETGNKYLDEIYNSQLWKDIEENFEYFNECMPDEDIRDFYKRLIWELANRSCKSQSDLVSKWIPCSERLPEIGDRVLVIDDDGDLFIDIRMGDILGEHTDERWSVYTHWQPLPEKPQI